MTTDSQRIPPLNASLPDGTHWPAQIDSAVFDIFPDTVHGTLPRVHFAGELPPVQSTLCATIFFGGSMEGFCSVSATPAAAYRLTDALLSVEGDWDDEMIADTLGEVCNMVTGGWKMRLPASSAICHLSVPVLSRQTTCCVTPQYPRQIVRRYSIHGAVLEVNLAILSTQTKPAL